MKMSVFASSNKPFPQHLDDTMISAFRQCPTYWYWKYFRNLRDVGDLSIDLLAGGAYAAGLETARKLFWSANPPPLEEVFHQARISAIKKWGNEPLYEDKPKSLPNILLAIEDYFKHWGVSTDPVQPVITHGGDPAVEFSFALPLPIEHPSTGEPILYTGKLDLLAQRIGQVWAVDDKTSSGFGPSWLNAWDMRSQFTGYTWAARESGLTIAGIIVRGCAFTPTGHKFMEVLTPRPDWMVQAWLKDTVSTIQRMINCWHIAEYPQAMNSACNAYNRPCDFTTLCTKNNPEQWIKANYKEVIWNPLEETIA
jgi:hypothetical protein